MPVYRTGAGTYKVRLIHPGNRSTMTGGSENVASALSGVLNVPSPPVIRGSMATQIIPEIEVAAGGDADVALTTVVATTTIPGVTVTADANVTPATVVATATVPTPTVDTTAPFDPDSIAGLEAWWDFSDVSSLWQDDALSVPITADAQTIGGVTDKSGGVNELQQATASREPAYKTGIINGLSVARFDGIDNYIESTGWAADTSRTVFIVAQKRSAIGTAPKVLLALHGDAVLFTDSDESATVYMWDAGSSGSNVPTRGTPTNVSIMVLRVNSAASLFVYANGGSPATFDPDNALTTATEFRLGATVTGTLHGDFDVGEVISYDTALSDSDFDLVGEYLADKWGVTWTSISGDTNVSPDTVIATATIPTPAVAADANVTPATVVATTTVPGVTVAADANITPTTVTGQATVPTPSVAADANVTPTTVVATAFIPTPTVEVAADADITATTVVGVATIPTPSVTGDANPNAPPADAIAAQAAVPTPVVTADANVTPTTVVATTVVPGVTVAADANVTTTTVVATAFVDTPIVEAGGDVAITPATVVATVTIPTPTVEATGDANVTPTTVVAIATIPSPVVTADANVTPTTVAAVAFVSVPGVTADANVTTTTVIGVAVVPTPTVEAEGAVTEATFVIWIQDD